MNARQKGYWPDGSSVIPGMPSLEEATNRVAIGHANYNGDISINPLEAKGPNYMGELMWPVSVEYDSETNKTKTGFTLVPPPVPTDG